ncbi:hypothetical protein [Anaerospora hongkongensis]|uniref:hypothetical protein n=1 Tax=Anaerospora hongkongensis TaxID=244830 RepID=UPI00289FECCC|nr:hypothetical protein [Anaerospora hongkongensis]
MEKIAPGSSKYSRYIIIGALLLLIIAGCTAYYFYHKHTAAETKLHEAVTFTEQQATNINYLQNELNMSKQNAEALAAEVEKAKTGKMQPVVSFSLQAPTVQEAAGNVKDRINAKDPTLPPAAIADSDRTLSVTQQVKQPDGSQSWQVGVYKVNNYTNWYLGAGLGWHKGDFYIPVAAQCNFSKDAAIEAQAHINPADIKDINGGQVMYKRAVNKLFFGVF